MTRTQSLMLLIEAANPMTHKQLQDATGWRTKVFNSALRRLESYGVVRRCSADGSRVCYRPSC